MIIFLLYLAAKNIILHKYIASKIHKIAFNHENDYVL